MRQNDDRSIAIEDFVEQRDDSAGRFRRDKFLTGAADKCMYLYAHLLRMETKASYVSGESPKLTGRS